MKENPKNTFVSIPKFPGVRKRLTNSHTCKEDWTFYIQYRTKDGSNKVIMKKLGKASEGWTAKKAYLEKEKLLENQESLTDLSGCSDSQNNFNQLHNYNPLQHKAEYSSEASYNDNCTIWELWLDYKEFNSTMKTLRTFAHYVKKLEAFHKLNPMQINNRMIQDFRKKLETTINSRGHKYSAQSIAHHLKALRILINHGVKRELCRQNPNLRFELPKIDNKVTEFLTEEQLTAYKKALDEDTDKIGVIFLKIALYTGMRKNAILHLKWSDINFETNQIMLRGENAKSGKTNFIPLPSVIKEALTELPKHSEYIFADKNGNKPRENFKRTALRVKNKAGLPKNFRPTYMLRHNFATHLASSGKVDLYTIQKLLTHESPQMTLRYAHLMDKTLQEGSKIIEDLFSKQ